MNRYTYKEKIRQTYENCFVTDSFEAFSEAALPFQLKERRVLMIAEKKFSGFYLKELAEIFGAESRSFDVFELPDEAPDFHLCAAQINALAEKIGLEPTDCILSLGSFVSDAAAKVFSAEYFPGILYIKIPVTFIGQLLSTAEGDAELDLDLEKAPGLVLMPDGSAAGNVREMLRNCSPALVYINIAAYKFLEETDRISGIGEAFRCAISSDAALFAYMEAYSGKKADDLYDFLLNVIMNCLRMNHAKEANPDLVKFGYTIAKGLEKCTNYIIPHGQAVGIGLIVADNVSANRKLLKDKDLLRIAKSMVTFGLSVMMNFTNDLIDAICDALSKSGMVSEDGALKDFVIPDKIGKVRKVSDITLDEIKTAMNYRR